MVEKSLVLAFLINFFDRFAAFFRGSFLKKIQDFFGNIFKKSSEKSFFVKFFTTAPTVKKTVNQSVIAKILTAICIFFAIDPPINPKPIKPTLFKVIWKPHK